ncbi:MAG: hypothetical protein LQ345_006929 [Seirophora villosa]|nr:MAG: hypothetical protein LQ345_006929 [Seirophora villosa]
MPDAQAVCGWDGDLTYAELDKLSDSAATGLIEKGVKPGVFVPFAYEKSIYAVVAMLGILKAGAALVPLNPKDPLARLSDIVSSVKAEVVATTDAFASVFRPLVTHVTVISKKSLKVSVSKRDGLITVQPSDPMLVLFTSGSTGRPKGMLHTHASMTTHAVTHGTAMSYQNARVFQFAAYTFDVAIFDVFTTLLFGGCICVPSEADRSSNIVGAITSMQVNYAILTPSFAGLINPAEVPTLQTLAVGGEALPHDRIERWAEKVRLIQIYGPAEVAICLTVRMQADTPGAVVGYPLANSSCWLVDPDYTSRLVPIGAVGELVVAGPSLAVGYLNDEVRTRLSFIDAPLWASHLQLPFTRFYKTGDLLRYNLDSFDGSFIFLGRKDAQIKLRGQRIEPGEVELHIGRLPGVAFSMVIKPDKGCYQDQLIAVVQMASANGSSAQMVVEDIQLASNPTLTIDDVQRELKKVLPSYMVPIQCLVVRNMPFVPSLKIDRRRVLNWLTEMVSRPLVCSLATLDALGTDESTARCLSMYIAQLLAVNGQAAALEMHNFRLQDAGVDSIKLIALTMLVQKEYGITIPMDALVHPQTTIRNLAGWIDNHDSFAQPRAIDPFHESSLLSQGLLKQIEADSIAAAAATPHRVLLTGASGYLGSAIIHQLLQTPHTQVSALMRCDTPALGLQRLQTILSRKNCWHPQYAPRIRIWPGSLASPDLGLAPHHLAQLRGRASDLLFPSPQHPCRAVVGEEEEDAPPINAIIHAGATVHYTLPYNALYATNITSTLLLLRLSARNPHLRTFTYISGGETPNVDSTSTSPAYLAALSRQANGYTLTKNIAERVVLGHAASTTARIRVIKPGYIIGSLTSGHDPNPADFIWRLVAACVQLRAFNRDDAHRWLYLDDADSVAARVVAATTDTNSTTSSGNIERVLTGLRVGEVWSAVERVYNGVLVFEQLDAGEWGRRARAKAEEQGGMGSMSAVVHLLEREEGGRVGVDGGDATVVAEEGKEEEGRRVEGLVEGNLRALMRMGVLPMVDVGLG